MTNMSIVVAHLLFVVLSLAFIFGLGLLTCCYFHGVAFDIVLVSIAPPVPLLLLFVTIETRLAFWMFQALALPF